MPDNMRIALVTGGGRGIGAGITAALAANGFQVIICGRTEPAQLAQGVRFVACDVRDFDDCAQLAVDICAREGRLDLLVNNAGGGPDVASATASPRLSEKIVALNLLAPLYMAQACHDMLHEARGSIVNIASVSAIRPSPRSAVYGAAKAGLLSLTQSLSVEWAPEIRVNAVVVGLVASDEALEHLGGAEGIDRIKATIPLGRMITPDDVAAAVLFLASPGAAAITGIALPVHGGHEIPAYFKLGQTHDGK